MTRDEKAADVLAALRHCQVSSDGQHVMALVNPFRPRSERNQLHCIRCLKSGDDL